MANLYPNQLNTDTTPTNADVLVIQKDGETEVKQASITNIFGNNGTNIKSAYEAEAETNAYVDADVVKVGHLSVTSAINLDNVPEDASYIHTDNNYTTADKSKVDKIESIGALVDGVAVAVDMSTQSQFTLSTTQDFTLNNPTGLTIGQRGYIEIIQDATGSRLITLDTSYKTAGGSGITLSTAVAAVDVLRYEIISSSLVLVELIADIK